MRYGTAASARRSGVVLALSFMAAFGLAGCGSIDDMLFGSETTEPAAEAPTAPQAPAAGETAPVPGTLPGAAPEAGTMPQAIPATATGAPQATSGITAVAIESGPNTGTSVGHTVQSLRAQVTAIQERILSDAQQVADLRATAAQSSLQYHEAKSTITARLQLGTTRGNPELVARWNNAQTALDSMTGTINSLNAVGTDISNQASAAHFALTTIEASFNLAGAVDEDHHQLAVLRDETDQIIVIIDSLLNSVSDAVQRHTTYVANERSSLTTLASAIKDGSYYGDLGNPVGIAPASFIGGIPAAGPALVTIRFNRTRVDYQQILYTAVAQAIQSRPGSGFAVVAVSPTKGSAAAVQLAQTEAERHARDVVRSLTNMGIPANRLDLSSSTDPGITASEVRVYVR